MIQSIISVHLWGKMWNLKRNSKSNHKMQYSQEYDQIFSKLGSCNNLIQEIDKESMKTREQIICRQN